MNIDKWRMTCLMSLLDDIVKIFDMCTSWGKKYHYFLLSAPSTLSHDHHWKTTKTTRELDHNNLYHWITLGGRLRLSESRVEFTPTLPNVSRLDQRSSFAMGADSPHWEIKKSQNCCPTLLYMGQMFWPMSIVPMLTCRQTDIFGTIRFWSLVNWEILFYLTIGRFTQIK